MIVAITYDAESNLNVSVDINGPSDSNLVHSTLYLKKFLHDVLGKLEPFSQCILLDHPDHTNVGDSMIWCGELLYLVDVLKISISYAASIKTFSEEELNKQDSNLPIILNGGGNFGDLWTSSQEFRNYVISKYKKRRIIIFPQTIYFANPERLTEAANIFNSHPNLIVFVRDCYSYEIAKKYFQNCRAIQSPDLALEMIGMSVFLKNYRKNNLILYHAREDKEVNLGFSPECIHLDNLVIEDWRSQKYQSEYYKNISNNWLAQRSARVWQRWQEGIMIPTEWFSRQLWKYFHPCTSTFNKMYNPAIHRNSWSNIHQGIYQFKKYRLVITNRLHGHILCILMGIPHIFLPNLYYKNEKFYETWTYQIPFCRFVKDPSKVEITAQELLALY